MLRLGAMLLFVAPVIVPGRARADWRLVMAAAERPETGWFGKALNLLGGIEVNGALGRGRVVSRIEEYGARQDVASGEASRTGWGVSVGGPPDRTGLVISPNLGYFSQVIHIADFRRDLPDQPDPADGTQIPAVCSDPVTGQLSDCSASNVYELKLGSFFAGVRTGYQVLVRRSPIDLFIAVSLAGNVVEWRTQRTEIGSTEPRKRQRVDFLASASGRLELGVHLRGYHVALRVSLDLEMYRRFRYPTLEDPVTGETQLHEFRGPIVFDEDKQVWERRRVQVEGAQVQAWTAVGALVYVF